MTQTIRFPITGMTCGSCVNRITRSLKKVDGVSRVKVDLARETATVECGPDVSEDALATAVASAGYHADLGAAVVITEPEKRGFAAHLLGHLH